MKKLLKTAFAKPNYLVLLCFCIISSLLFTGASQLEMFSLGVITKKGPDFFELFAPEKNGVLVPGPAVTREQLETRFKEIDKAHVGLVTHESADQFLQEHKAGGVINEGLSYINRVYPIEKSIWYLVGALIFVALFKASTLFSYRYGTKLMAIRISQDLRQSYFEHIQSLPISFYQEHNIGSLSSRVVNDAYMIADGINSMLVNYLQTPFAFLTTFVFCFFISWQLSLAVFFGFPLLIIPIILLAKRVKKLSKQIQKKQEAFASVLIEFLAGIQTIKLFAMEEFSLRKYCEQNNQMAVFERKSAKYDLSARPILHTIGIFCLVTALLFGLYGLNLPLHEVLFYCGLLSCVYEPIKKFAEENARIQRGLAACDRMYEVLDVKPQINDIDGAITLTHLNDKIEFKEVYFKYDTEWVLRGVSFTAKKGETVAIVGPTGAGKSTIAMLMPRLYDIQRGEICIDGKPVTAYTQKSLREMISFVPQRSFLFFDTVAENIAYGKPFSREAIKQAAVQAHADEFIQKLEHGYDTILAEAGKSLSGGQQQRLAIARALVKKAPILIMDEATSSLDALSENHIKQALKSLQGTTTQIIIAHRLSTIEDADKIIYLERGAKIAEGTKDELIDTCPQFRRMWELLKHR